MKIFTETKSLLGVLWFHTYSQGECYIFTFKKILSSYFADCLFTDRPLCINLHSLISVDVQ